MAKQPLNLGVGQESLHSGGEKINANFTELYNEAANKSNDILDIASTSKFPVWKVITDWAVGLFATIANLALKANITTPTFTTNITTPLVIGGTGAESRVTYKSTTGIGTPSSIAHQFLGGTDGATVLATILNNGNFGLGATPVSKMYIASLWKPFSGGLSDSIVSIASTDVATIDKGGTLQFGGKTNGIDYAFGGIMGLPSSVSGGNYSGYLSFHTTNSNSSMSEKLRILSNGNVLIATTTDNTIDKLQVNGSIQTNNLLKLGQYTTATRPAYVKGAMFFDTTLNKMVIGGASAYETVTSV